MDTQKKVQNRTRNCQINIRASQEEKDFIMKKFTKSGAGNFNIYALKMLTIGNINNVDLTYYHELAKEVSRIGTSINQVAKFINSNGRVYAAEIEESQRRVAEIWQLLKSNLSEVQSKNP